jgi:hypothetical protein
VGILAHLSRGCRGSHGRAVAALGAGNTHLRFAQWEQIAAIATQREAG